MIVSLMLAFASGLSVGWTFGRFFEVFTRRGLRAPSEDETHRVRYPVRDEVGWVPGGREGARLGRMRFTVASPAAVRSGWRGAAVAEGPRQEDAESGEQEESEQDHDIGSYDC